MDDAVTMLFLVAVLALPVALYLLVTRMGRRFGMDERYEPPREVEDYKRW
jgi:hypothetical protein